MRMSKPVLQLAIVCTLALGLCVQAMAKDKFEMEVDKEAEGEAQEKSLRGVRKAQIKMATYFLLHEDQERAQRIYLDMKHEPIERIRSIRVELLAVESKDFWEVIDRGENFDYLNPERRALLKDFFSRFPQLVAESARPSGAPSR